MRFNAYFVPSHFHRAYICLSATNKQMVAKNTIIHLILNILFHPYNFCIFLISFFEHFVFPLQFVDYHFYPSTHLTIIPQKVITAPHLQPNKPTKIEVINLIQFTSHKGFMLPHLLENLDRSKITSRDSLLSMQSTWMLSTCNRTRLGLCHYHCR